MNEEKIKMNFKCRIDNLELSSCDEQLANFKDHSTAEISKWDGDGRYVVASWKKDKEGFNLQFCGSRPFDVDIDIFMELARKGQRLLEAYNY